MHLILIGDIHVHHQWPRPWELFGKALLGQLNVWFNRSRRFDLHRMPALLERAGSLRPDLLVFSGDLTSIASSKEFEDAREMLSPLLDRFPAVMVPGNHDRYTFGSVAFRRMEKAFPGVLPDTFPSSRKLTQRWSMVTLNSSVPRTFSSRGYLGPDQLAYLRLKIQETTPGQGLVVLTHYALGKPSKYQPPRWSHRLKEHQEMLDELGKARGRVVFMHGHVHMPWWWEREELLPARVLDINSGAPCLVTDQYPAGQGFWSIRLPDDPDGAVTAEHHALAPGESGRWAVTAYGQGTGSLL